MGAGGKRSGLRHVLLEKWQEATRSILPIVLLVLALCFLTVPLPTDALGGFVFAAVLLVAGMGLFSLGTEMAMTPIGGGVGQSITRSRRVWLVVLVGFLVGVFVTIAEPDLTVLAMQVAAIPNWTLILCVALGVGIFLMLALLRILYRVKLWKLLAASYALVFLLALFVPDSFLPVAFDSGGVTTGPMTVPFILALGAGVAASRGDKGAEADSFGLVALASVGPVLAVMLLGIIYSAGDGESGAAALLEAANSMLLFRAFTASFPEYLAEVGRSLLPVLAFFAVFQFATLHLKGNPLRRILIGLAYTYFGLVLFLLGVNVGFMPVGGFLGRALGGSGHAWTLVPLGMVLGWFTVSAEPAVQVLSTQVYEMTAGAVPKKALMLSLSAGVAVSIGLSMARVLLRIPLLAFLVPGYLLAMGLMAFCPPMFTAIAFDSGGVASGPMTASFILPLAMGASQAKGGNAAADAFGVVAMVAMTPLIAIQVLGVITRFRQRTAVRPEMPREEIIEL